MYIVSSANIMMPDAHHASIWLFDASQGKHMYNWDEQGLPQCLLEFGF
jgi:hypothetical protein